MPFPALDYPDRAVWRDSPRGKFEVKSAYLLACRMVREKDPSPMPSSPPSGFWKCLWKWKLPPKVRHFLWRLYTDSLPTGANMCKKGMEVQQMCFFCGQCGEEAVHIFQQCDYVKDICAELDMPAFPHGFICSIDLLKFGANVCEEELLYLCLICSDRLINVECCIK
ncbi:hypothetical protein LIER_36749 [Lithospermum erythrorhizon]|uniref:Reverse transcriptase zinc-binding domain-containing protein n=1 Tax=Lithospermum erythrorhizon TaxID=34254 RepID=A0AAV3PBE2_LITER